MAGSEDEVVLRDGSFLRGRIVEISTGHRVVIQPAAGGEPRDLAWADIDVIRRASGETAQAADAPTRPPPERRLRREEPSPTVPGVHVDFDLEKDRPVTLYEVFGEAHISGTYGSAHATGFRALCDSPCGRRVETEPATRYFVSGRLVTPSRKFTISDRDRVTLRVKPGSKAVLISGVTACSVGIILLSVGAPVLATGMSNRDTMSEAGEENRRRSRRSGGAMLGVGGVLTIVGIPLLLAGRTKVAVE